MCATAGFPCLGDDSAIPTIIVKTPVISSKKTNMRLIFNL